MYSYNIHKAKALHTINMHEILKKLEELYCNNLVYRTIIVCDNTENCKAILNTNNYDAMVIDRFENINYDSLDIRIFLIDKGDFIAFIKESNDQYFYNAVILNTDTLYAYDIESIEEIKKISNKDIIII